MIILNRQSVECSCFKNGYRLWASQLSLEPHNRRQTFFLLTSDSRMLKRWFDAKFAGWKVGDEGAPGVSQEVVIHNRVSRSETRVNSQDIVEKRGWALQPDLYGSPLVEGGWNPSTMRSLGWVVRLKVSGSNKIYFKFPKSTFFQF